ncbi:MAG: hypothetical protein DI556_09970 [Rhodovulum sulfidophilum]|uniref:Uncharacterized protein n=1 Tax=Rhodovulum sulfidophilum TaxID=35806 RepID=A0A2W5PY11_RHOSU|nr:MAG: hypothetical protein DI556_09970 [Rhodovulum sulfidophilum]
MNREQGKILVATLEYMSAVAESIHLLSFDGTRDARELLGAIEKEAEHMSEVISTVLSKLPAVDPEFSAIHREVREEAARGGRIWSEQRAEKIALLRLAGDDTPEEQIP